MRPFSPLAFALAFAGGALALTLPSGGPVLLGYRGSFLPVGACRAAQCWNIGAFAVSNGFKGYVYKTRAGVVMSVYRDAAGAIRGGEVANQAGAGPNDATTRFIQGMTGVKWSPALQQACFKGGEMYTGRAGGQGFEIACAAGEGQDTIDIFDTRLSAADLNAVAQAQAAYWH